MPLCMQFLWSPGEGAVLPGAGVVKVVVSPPEGMAENRTQVFCKSSTCF